MNVAVRDRSDVELYRLSGRSERNTLAVVAACGGNNARNTGFSLLEGLQAVCHPPHHDGFRVARE
jgi:hypothetical protein